MQFFGYVSYGQQLKLITSDNNRSVISVNASPTLLASPVLPLATFSLTDFEMQNAAQSGVPEGQVIIVSTMVLLKRDWEEILQGQLLLSLP